MAVLESDSSIDCGEAPESATAATTDSPLTRTQMHLAMLAAVTLPPLGVMWAMYLLWGGWFDWSGLVALVVMYIATGLGVTIGYHRLFAHKAFVTTTPISVFLMILGGMSAQGPLIWWVGTHRRHHRHSDQEEDPHSPHAHRARGVIGWTKGFLHAHVGWLFTSTRESNHQYVPDLLGNPTIMRINRLFPLWVAAGLVLPGIVCGLVTMTWTGAALGVLWGGLIRMFLLHHSTWSINSVCHVWGWRDYRSDDHSRNNPVMGILSFGEGWHNNHHAFPTSARHGLKWWQLDVSWLVIRSLQACGLATHVRLPTESRMKARRRGRPLRNVVNQ